MRDTTVTSQSGPLTHVAAQAQLEDVLRNNHEQVSLQVQNYARRQTNLIGRLFPDRMERLFRDQQLATARTELEFRHRLLDLHVEFQLASLTEKYEAWLKVLKVEYRGQFIGFVTERQQVLRRDMDKRRQDYVRDDAERWAFYEQFKHLPSGQVYGTAIQEESVKYFEWLTRLLSDFQNIVDEKIKSYRA